MDPATADSRLPTGTAGQILDVAERLAQTRGFNGFSYADISAELGITKATLHYHFRTKAELGRTLIARYQLLFRAALAGISGWNVCSRHACGLHRSVRNGAPRRPHVPLRYARR